MFRDYPKTPSEFLDSKTPDGVFGQVLNGDRLLTINLPSTPNPEAVAEPRDHQILVRDLPL